MTDPSILTIILNYKTADMTLRSVQFAVHAMHGLVGEIVVVDNASGDGSFEKIAAAIKANGWFENNRVRAIQSDRNGGFGAGNNIGILAGLSTGEKPDFVYVLNSDAFPAKDAILKLRNHLVENPNTGLAGSYVHGQDGGVHLTTFRFPSAIGELEMTAKLGLISRLFRGHSVAVPTPDQAAQVDWLAGASVLMCQTMLDQVGLFDEAFFLYFEETDLCLRAKRAGWQTDFVRSSEVEHIGSVSTGLRDWTRVPGYWHKSRVHYFVKNHGTLYAIAASAMNVLGTLIHRAKCTVLRRENIIKEHYLRDICWYLLTGISKGHVASRAPKPMARVDQGVQR